MMMRTVSLLACLMLTAASVDAWCQTPPADKAAENPPSDQAVTFADLHGTTLDINMMRDQVVRREGRQFPVTMQTDLTITIGRDGIIDQVFTPTAHTARGPRRGKTLTGTFALNHTRDVGSLGGGQAVWTFNDGALVMVRTFKEGAYRRTIAFTRGPKGITCTASETYAREKGSGPITLKSSIDGAPTVIVSYKQASSTCRISRREGS
jgi:hypothetical protein